VHELITTARESDSLICVSQSTDPLPTDIATLQALLAQARAERDAVIAERNHLQSQNDRLQHLLRQLQRAQFGRSSEKLDPDQLHLAFEDIEQAIAASEADDDKRDPAGARARAARRRVNRGALPAHLPRVHVTIEPDDTKCPCCQGPMHVIGEETSQRLDVIPAQYRVIVTRRPKYACRACEQAVVQAPAPERLIKGGLPTEAMVASVLVAKYAWHLPLYRQAQMLAAQGLDLTRAVLAFWVGYAAAELKPVYLRLRELILASGKIAVDETVAPVLDPGRGRTKQGYFWAVARDDRPWGGTDPPAIAFSYAPGRGAIHGLKLLEGYRGIVQCDGYAAYKKIAAAPGEPSRSPSVGRICGAGSSTLPRAVTRRSRAKRLSGSPRSMRSRRRSAGRAPMNGVKCVRTRANRSWNRFGPGSSSSSRAFRPRRRSPRRSAMA
jgi:transposase